MPKRRAVDKLAGTSGFLEALRKRRAAVESGSISGLRKAPEEFRKGLRSKKNKK